MNIEELINYRNNIINDIKSHEDNKIYNQDYIRLNDSLAQVSKLINTSFHKKRFSYNRCNVYGNNYPTNYIVFDTETTGLDPANNEIIEYTFIKYENNKLVDKLTSLVKPKELIPEFITSITGITNEMVSSSLEIDEHLESIIEFINGSVIVGHNVLFDIKFLESAVNNSKYDLDELSFTYIDTVALARRCIFDTPNHKLETLKEYFNIDTISHRSENDCEVTKIVYEKCIEMLINQQI